MTTEALIAARGAVKEFILRTGFLGSRAARLQAVREVDLDVAEGETLGVVGESGCGKTTLGRLLVGLYEPTRGQIVWRGRDLGALTPIERRQVSCEIQMVFQDPYASLNPRKTVAQIIGAPLAWQGLSAKPSSDPRLLHVLELVNLPAEVLGRYPHEFSGGQRQRIGIARALVLQPRLLVLDEPLSALDTSVQAHILNLLADLQRRLALTMVFISHDLAAVRWACDRTAVMYLGRIVEIAPTAQLFARPQHPYTRALLAATPRGDPTLPRVRPAVRGEPGRDMTGGCDFAARCPFAAPDCVRQRPTLQAIGGGADHHRVACLRVGEIPVLNAQEAPCP